MQYRIGVLQYLGLVEAGERMMMDGIKETRKEGLGLSRRSFISLSAGTMMLAGLGLSGCSLSDKSVESPSATGEGEEETGEWRTAICWHNCGGRCLNQVYVVDNIVVRQKTDDTHEDSPDFPQQRACARGRSNRNQVFGPDRIKYPVKRKNWSPGGGTHINGDLRGKDEWERISWDEALDYVSSEIKRIAEAYGPSSIYIEGSEIMRLFTMLGGYATSWGSTSYGTWDASGACFGAFVPRKDLNINNQERTDQNDRFELRNSELVIMWGQNSTWSGAGNPTYYYLAAKRAGAKFVFIDPFYNNTAQALDAEWIPIRPGTDHAMALGMMYTLLDEDDPTNNPLIDWDFLKRCTVGFTADNMPAGVDPAENFQDYILGVKDGLPKTPEWAFEICGVSADTIRDLARRMATTKKVAFQSSYAPARVNNADSWPQAFMTLGWMCGHVGETGRMTGVSCRYNAANGGPELVVSGSQGVPTVENEEAQVVELNNNELWEAILNGKYTAGKDDVRECNIQMIYHGGASALNQKVAIFKGIEAHRKVEFVVTQHFTLNTSARYSDIILPITTRWERFGDFGDGNNRKKEVIIYGRQITPPLFEAKDDYEIAELLGNKLGFDGKIINPVPIEQRIFNAISTIKVVKDDGSDYESLVAITAEDIAELSVEGEPQEGRMSYKDFVAAGKYQVERYAGDPFDYIAHKAYREDPEANPQPTDSGKFEIYSDKLAKKIESYGWTTVDPYPSYNRPVEGYEDTFNDWASKVKGKYPLQFYPIHYARRGHSNFDNIPWLREVFPQECFMNTVDAEERGIKDDDVILIENSHGKTMRHVKVTNRLCQGVLTMGEGAWVEMDEELGIDRAGNVNTLNGDIPTGQGHAGYSTCIVQVSRLSETLEPDYLWPTRIELQD
jgi:anaerobic dimethyl sulfoxide reductase subunit A